MRYYYEDKWVKIIHGDCREILPCLDCKVDLVLTSPPYGDMYFGYDIDGWVKLMSDTIPKAETALSGGGKLVINVNNYITSRKAGWDKRQVIPLTMYIQQICKLNYQDEI